MEVRLWLVDVAERNVATGERQAEDRVRHVARRAVLRTILGEVLQIAPAAVSLDRAPCPLCGGPHGRPVVAGGSAAFSVASTPGVIAVAVGPAPVEVGVGVEAAGRMGAGDLAASLHPREQAALDRLPPSRARDLAALRCRTRKEALLKGLGTGLGVDPAGVRVGLAPTSVDDLGCRPATTAGPAGWTLVDLPMLTSPDHRAPTPVAVALAYRAPGRVAVEVVETRLAELLRPHEPAVCRP